MSVKIVNNIPKNCFKKRHINKENYKKIAKLNTELQVSLLARLQSCISHNEMGGRKQR